VLNFFL
jgi:hypothetical protein